MCFFLIIGAKSRDDGSRPYTLLLQGGTNTSGKYHCAWPLALGTSKEICSPFGKQSDPVTPPVFQSVSPSKMKG